MAQLLAIYLILTLLLVAALRWIPRRLGYRYIGVPLVLASLAFFCAVFLATGWFAEVLR